MSESSSSPSQWVLRVWEADMPEWMGRMETLRDIPRLTSSERELVLSFIGYLKEHEFLTPRQLEVLRRVAGRYGVELPPIPRPSASSPKAVRRRRLLKGTLYSKGAEHGHSSPEARIVASYGTYWEAVREQDLTAVRKPEYLYEVLEFDGVWELREYQVSPEASEQAATSITNEERGLIAGLVVGEAHIAPYKTHRTRMGEKIYYERYPKVDICSADMDVVERGKEIAGGLIMTCIREPYEMREDKRVWLFGRKPQYYLEVSYGRAYDLLKQTQHLLVGTKIYRGKRYATRELARMVVEDPHYSMKVKPRWHISEEEFNRLRAG